MLCTVDRRLKRARAHRQLALGVFLVPGYPDWPTSFAARDMTQEAGVDFIEYPVVGPGNPSDRTGAAVTTALAHLGADGRQCSTRYIDWISGLQTGVAVVYEAAWPAATHWNVGKEALKPAHALLLEWNARDITARARLAQQLSKPVIPALRAGCENEMEVAEALLSQNPPFVYLSLGEQTGMRSTSFDGLACTVAQLRATGCSRFLCAAFGLGDPNDMHAVAETGADGAIIGSYALTTLSKGLNEFRKWLDELTAASKECNVAPPTQTP